MKNSTIVKITLLLAATLTVMAGATIAPSLPKISEVFAANPNAALLSKLVLTIPALLIALSAPFVGGLINKFGRLRLLYFSLAVYALAGSSGLYLSTLPAILMGRALLGVAVGGIMTVISTLVGDYFEGEERNKFSGLQSMFMSIGGIVFVSLGGVLADMNWRFPFAIYLFSFLVILLVALSLKEPNVSESLDGDIESTPAIPKSRIALILATVFISMVIFYMIPVQIPFLLEKLNIGSTSLSGLAIAFATIGGALGSAVYARLKKSLSFEMLFAIAFAFIAAGYLIIGFSGEFMLLTTGLLIAGIGVGFIMPNGTIWLLQLAPIRMRGTIMGFFTSVLFLGQFVSPLLVEPLTKIDGLQSTFLVAATLGLMIFLAYIVYDLKSGALKPRAIL